ncbi:phosphoribosyltransferase [Aminobacter sp. DSM 101952]|uniref:phosphoribosyltransferase n=1 Tax=Aminobacter TaxID=31988 RepID=UPI0006FEDF9A|nr:MULTISPECIES: phosphoribosyltransferase family protein [Aminobacter]AWC23713.1 Putative phosphoribosyl transferase [Aminobacter sp. MSH1]KQU70058.1 phosphoribosyltransferase [Aminobacter sp. DSM 101952]CAI2934395.1 Phosphoribosyltransferase [Aminobacter niigataensis]
MFRDRQEAGEKLGRELQASQLRKPVVLALPRGGLPVAAAVAKALDAPLDILIVRKVGAPTNPELAVAAIVDGDPPDVVINREIVEAYSLSDDELAALIKMERPELERRRQLYRGSAGPRSLAGRTAILVDDGAATGTTIKVALRAIKRRGPLQTVVAIPVASSDALATIEQEADKVVCLSKPGRFLALGYHYVSFPQLTDDDVTEVLRCAAEERKLRHPSR